MNWEKPPRQFSGKTLSFIAIGSLWLVCLRPTAALPFNELDSAPSMAESIGSLSPSVASDQDRRDVDEVVRCIQSGDLEKAAKLAKAFLVLQPNSAPGNELLGAILMLQGKADDGLAYLECAVRINPSQYTAVTKIGDLYYARGDFEKAKARFLQAVALAPFDRFAHQRIGLILEREGDRNGAINHFEKGLVGTAPAYLGIKVNLGSLYNQQRDFEKTTRLLSSLVSESCRDGTAHLVLGSAWLGLLKPDLARACFERAKALAPSAEGVQLALGIACREAGDLTKAKEEIALALKTKPGWALAEYQMAETLVASGDLPAAAAAYSRAAATAEHPAPIRNRLAECFAAQRLIDRAIETYQLNRTEGVADLRTYEGLATLLEVSGKLAEAENALREAERKFPGSVRVQVRLGMHFAFVRDYDRAAEFLSRARDASPTDPQIPKALSLVAVRQGNRPKAITEARRLLVLAPDGVDDRFYLGSLLEEDGQDTEAASFYEEVLRQMPTHVLALNNLAQVRLRAKEAKAALELARRAFELAPENPAVLDTIGWSLFQNGDSKAARQKLELAVARAKGAPASSYHLAAVLNDLGFRKEALTQLDVTLKSGTEFGERAAAQALADALRSRL